VPLAASWHSNKFLHRAHDGAVLPILHLSGYAPVNFAHHGHPCPIQRLTLNVTVS